MLSAVTEALPRSPAAIGCAANAANEPGRAPRKARQLGATHSHFVNPNGLPIPNQYSTARDLSIIAKAAYANAIIRSIVCMPKLVFRYANGRM